MAEIQLFMKGTPRLMKEEQNLMVEMLLLIKSLQRGIKDNRTFRTAHNGGGLTIVSKSATFSSDSAVGGDISTAGRDAYAMETCAVNGLDGQAELLRRAARCDFRKGQHGVARFIAEGEFVALHGERHHFA